MPRLAMVPDELFGLLGGIAPFQASHDEFAGLADMLDHRLPCTRRVPPLELLENLLVMADVLLHAMRIHAQDR